MNPFDNLSSQYCAWPVLLVIYNLPPWLCMKRKYIMLSLHTSAPKQHRNDIDVYLTLLVENLRKMWDEGVFVFNAHANKEFTLRAILLCTVNDLFGIKLGTQHYLVYIIELKWLDLKTIIICLILRSKLRF